MSGRDRTTAAALLLALAGLSGFCALAYEVLYVRHVTTLLGDTAHVHAALLSTFLLGVAAGARWAWRAYRWLFALEIATGLFALALPLVTRALGDAAAVAAITGSPALSVAVTAVLLGGPSVAIGFSLPLFAAYLKAVRPGRLAFQGVYGVYNAGAFAGILASELLLVEAMGVSGALAFLGAVNVAIGLTLLATDRDRFGAPDVEERAFRRRTLAALAAASFASSLFQMFLLRVVYLVLGPHRENFAIGLAVVLAGIALGAWAVARLGLRFRGALLLLPPVLAGTFLLHVPLVRLAHALRGVIPGGPGAVLADAGVAAAYGLLPMILFGALVPALMVRERAVAEEAGRLLWVSGVANAAGYVAYVFVAHPLLSTPTFLTVVAVLALGAVVLVGDEGDAAGPGAADGRPRRRGRRAGAGALVAAGAGGLVALHAAWSEPALYLASWIEDLGQGERVTIFKSRGESATLLEREGGRWISYNGHPSIMVSRDGVVNTAEVASGVIPALAAPRLDRALVLGLGTGITAGAAAVLFDTVDVAEINPGFVDMAPLLADANLDVLENPSARVGVADGRAFLVQHEDAYDAIVNSIPAPTYFSASKIYTSEFYERVVRALRPDGVFSTWLATGEMSGRGIETVVRTLAAHFEVCDLRILRDGYYMATCGRDLRTRALDDVPGPGPDAIRRVLAPGLPAGFDPAAYLESVRISADILEPGPPRGVLNTDDRPVLEFLLTRGARAASGRRNPFFEEPDRYGVRLFFPDEGPEEVADRLRALEATAPGWFTRHGAPLLRRSPALREAFAKDRGLPLP